MLKILNLKDIKMCSINNKFFAKNNRLIITSKYKKFKELIANSVKCDAIFTKDINIKIKMSCYIDLDAPIKAIIDGIELSRCIANDRFITGLTVIKNTIKKGQPETLEVWIDGE